MKFTHDPGGQPLRGYTIRRGLGQGGFGEVYLAVSDAGKEVALKLVKRHLDVELRGVSQCLNVKHRHLIQIYDILKAENGDCWIVMEYVSGESLDQVLARHPNGLPEHEAIAWMVGLCEGVSFLHSAGLVHRDLKPNNLFVDEGIVKIGDYGLSKSISASGRSGQTDSVGTVHYMAPEISIGRYGNEVDQYALGVIFYELLSGRLPFDGESSGEILMKHLTAQPDLAPLPAPYRPVVARLLDKDPDKRYPCVQDIVAALPQVVPVRPSAILRSATAATVTSHSDTSDAQHASRPPSAVPREPVPGRPRRTHVDTVNVVRFLVENGIEAPADIARVVEAMGEHPERDSRHLVAAVRILVENGMERSRDVARVVWALGELPEHLRPHVVTAVQLLVENGIDRGRHIARVIQALGERPEQDVRPMIAAMQILVENGTDRGRDIARVIHALGDRPERDLPAAVNALQDMVENGMDVGDIERALRAPAASVN